MKSMMEFLLSDVFDARRAELPLLIPTCVDTVSKCVKGSAILRHAALHTNLAFYDAWSSISGSFPSRRIFWHFIDAVNGKRRPADAVFEELLMEYIPSMRTVLRRDQINAIKAQLVDRFVKTRDSVAGDIERCRESLLLKLVDRHCLADSNIDVQKCKELITTPIAEAISLIYSKYTPKTLASFERWCCSVTDAPSIASDTVSGLYDYLSRSRSVISRLKLGSFNPISGNVAITPVSDYEDEWWSCSEALRHGIQLDGFLWRTDMNGVIYVSDPYRDKNVLFDRNSIRHCCMPWEIFLNACPFSLYSRVILRVGKERLQDVKESAKFVEMRRLAVMGTTDQYVVPFVDDETYDDDEKDVDDKRVCIKTVSLVGNGVGPFPSSIEFPFPSMSSPDDNFFIEAIQSDLILRYGVAICKTRLPLQRFVLRYAAARRLLLRETWDSLEVRTDSLVSNDSKGCIVLVDNRPNVWSVLAALITLSNLDICRWKALVVFCAPENMSFMKRAFASYINDKIIRVEFIELAELSLCPNADGTKFSIETYNTLLKSRSFWERLLPFGPYSLLIQDDGMIVRPGLESRLSRLFGYDYVGAPWMDVPANADLKKIVPNLVGNGGLSLRSIQACIDAIDSRGDHVRLFNNNLQPEPEDVFFASACCAKGGERVCSVEDAAAFAFEQRAPLGGDDAPIGFHKPWPYATSDEMMGLISGFLSKI